MLPRHFINRHRRRLLSLWTKQPGPGYECCRRRPRAGAQVLRCSGLRRVRSSYCLKSKCRFTSLEWDICSTPQIGFLLLAAGAGIFSLVDACYLCLQEGPATPVTQPPPNHACVLNRTICAPSLFSYLERRLELKPAELISRKQRWQEPDYGVSLQPGWPACALPSPTDQRLMQSSCLFPSLSRRSLPCM